MATLATTPCSSNPCFFKGKCHPSPIVVHTPWNHEKVQAAKTKCHQITDDVVKVSQTARAFVDTEKMQPGLKKCHREIKIPQMNGSHLKSLKSKIGLNCGKYPALVQQRKHNFTMISKVHWRCETRQATVWASSAKAKESSHRLCALLQTLHVAEVLLCYFQC